MKYKLTLTLVAFMTGSAFAAFQAPLPEFKNEKQLAEWRAEKASEPTSQGYAAEDTAFYTGKAYVDSSGGYAFKYRSYNPELARWTSEDPSGFPDGSNNSIYSTNPLSGVDPDGLKWTDEDFLKHFISGGGKTVNLDDMGLTEDVKAAAAKDPTGGTFKFGKQIELTAKDLAKPYQWNFADSFNNSYDFIDVVYSLGRASLKATYDGWMTSTANSNGQPGGSYSYKENWGNETEISFSDEFTDPTSVIQKLYGSSSGGPSWVRAIANGGGKAFKIVGSWQKSYTGFGNYE